MPEFLILGHAEMEATKNLIEKARLNPFSEEDIATAVRAAKVKGNELIRWKMRLDPYTISIPIGYMVTYTHEHRPEVGLCQHLNMSSRRGPISSVEAYFICKAFKMEEIVRDGTALKAWSEFYGNRIVSLHIIARLSTNDNEGVPYSC